MKYQAENAVSSFFYYMWNAWCEEECKVVYGDMYRHFWEKWSLMTDKRGSRTVLCGTDRPLQGKTGGTGRQPV